MAAVPAIADDQRVVELVHAVELVLIAQKLVDLVFAGLR